MQVAYTMLKKYSLAGIARRVLFVLRGRVVKLQPRGTLRGYVLLSYTTTPFTLLDTHTLQGHSNYWEVRDMADAFLERGYAVDVIDFHNADFIPHRPYVFFIDIAKNMERLTPLLPQSCKKIFFATGAHSSFQNKAEMERITSLEKRRGVALLPRRQAPDMEGVVHANILSGVCGPFPTSTYERFKKPVHMVPVSSSHTFPLNKDKDYGAAKKHFLWFGGAGAVHKGLDRVLEAFATMPEYRLTVCGKFAGEEDFVSLYHRELYTLPNITSVGYINPGSTEFTQICSEAIGVISLSCSEGTASSIVLAMHAGLIPIVNKETGVRVENVGVLVPDSEIETLKTAIRSLASLAPEMLRQQSLAAWEFARTHHTREQFGKEFRSFIGSIITS
jgi:glycosyltransferase involved in cell wall biosynthesis